MAHIQYIKHLWDKKGKIIAEISTPVCQMLAFPQVGVNRIER